MLTAALYARVSTEKQEREQTIRSQIEEVEKRIKDDGNILIDKYRFIDDGWSGSRLDRPALDNLRDAVKERKFDCLYIYDRDRLSRNFSQLLFVLEEMEKKTKVIFLHDPTINSPEDKVLLQFKGVVAELQRVQIAERTRRGKLSKARNGNIVHGPGPYGYKYIEKSANKQGYFVINQYEASIVKKIFEWIGNNGLTIRKVIKRLQEEEIKPRKSSRGVWNNSTLCKLIHNETYFGDAYYNKTVAIEPEKPLKDVKYKKVIKTSRRLKPRNDWIRIPVEPIINRALFDKAQEQLKRNAWFNDRCQKHDYLLSGLLFCSCGFRMSGEGVNNHRYYRCSSRVMSYPLKPDCSAAGINVKRIDGVVWRKIQKLLFSAQDLREKVEEWVNNKGGGSGNLDLEEIKRLKEMIEAFNHEEKKHAQAFGQDLISVDTLSDLMGELKLKRQSTINQIKKLETVQKEEKLPNISVDELVQYVPAALKSLLQGDRQAVLRRLISKIIVDKDRVNATIRGLIPINYDQKDLNYGFRSLGRDSWFAQRRQVNPV